MSKYIPFESPSLILGKKIPFLGYLRQLYFRFNKFDNELLTSAKDPRFKFAPYFLGGFNPLLGMAKDFIDTFKPYKSGFYVQRDFIQPLRGLGNIVSGLFHVIVSPLLFLTNTALFACRAILHLSFTFFLNHMKTNIIQNAGGFIDGVCNSIRGATQIAFTPLTWAIRMPLRGIITAITGMPTLCKNVEKRVSSLESLINKDKKTVEDSFFIDKELEAIRQKVYKANQRRQQLGFRFTPVPMLEKFTKIGGFPPPACYDSFAEGAVSGYYLDDNQNTKTAALKFLGLFKIRAKDSDVAPVDLLTPATSTLVQTPSA